MARVTRARFFAFGAVTIDDLVFADGSTLWRVPGGAPIYAALGMAVWGERPAVVAPIGPDYPADPLAGRIDLTRCRPIARTMRNWGLYEEDGTRCFIFRSRMGSWLDFCPQPRDLDAGPYPVCHLAPLPLRLQIEFANALRGRGASLISADPDARDLAEAPISEVARLMALVELFMPSGQEAAEIFPGLGPLDAMKALRDLAPETPVIVLKCGAAGAIAHERNAPDCLHAPSAAERAVDETGAGDAFCGGALVGFAHRRSLPEALARAAASASFAVEAAGPSGLLAASREEAEDRFRRVLNRIEPRPF